MIIDYDGKKQEEDILANTPKAKLKIGFNKEAEDKLICADNLYVLKTMLDNNYSGKINLVYIDPPFSTNSSFRICDERANTVSSCTDDDIAYTDELVGDVFLEFLRERLIFLRELLSDNGSIYLHIDYKIGHYVKLLMDEIFGKNMFRNDISRIKCNPKNFYRKAYGNIKGMILFYSKSNSYVWNEPLLPFSNVDKNKLFKKVAPDGRKYTTVPLHAPGETFQGETGSQWKGMYPPKGRHWRVSPSVLDELDKQGLIEWSKNGIPRRKLFLDDKSGKRMQDIWEFKDPQYPYYPTEKNLDLLKFIIKTSSNEGDIVLDCFSGSGTTLVAAQELNRRWVGIDKSEQAIKITKKKLAALPDTLFRRVDYSFFK
ncbi:MAG: site-specific DNA-methyltransferase [Endomicrobium sp.]|jgi:adenine-specific DNA-methyltransferase|nr:site-specific DNA-methyltransferase [Endomicrobium sp.]